MVRVREKVVVQADVLTRSKNAVANSVVETVLEVLYQRGLDPGYLLFSRKVLEDGLYTWLHERKLETVMLEVSLPGRDTALERWDFAFEYQHNPDETLRPAPTEAVGRLSRRLDSLPPGSTYRIMAQVGPGAKQVSGWEPTTLKHLDAALEERVGELGYGYISAQVVYRGAT